MALKNFRRRAVALVSGLFLSVAVWAGLESGTYISDLVVTNPLGSDLASTIDDHIRLLKSTIKTTFPNINGAMTATDEQLNAAGAGVYTASSGLAVSNTAPFVDVRETDGASNNQNWRLGASAETLQVQVCNDALNSCSNIITADRTANTVDAVNIIGTAVTANGSAVKTIANSGRIASGRFTSVGALQSGSVNMGAGVRNSLGNYTINYTSAGFTSAPSCSATAYDTVAGFVFFDTAGTLTNTAATVITLNSSFALADRGFSVICAGS